MQNRKEKLAEQELMRQRNLKYPVRNQIIVLPPVVKQVKLNLPSISGLQVQKFSGIKRNPSANLKLPAVKQSQLR
jgi:hypothetical protein